MRVQLNACARGGEQRVEAESKKSVAIQDCLALPLDWDVVVWADVLTDNISIQVKQKKKATPLQTRILSRGPREAGIRLGTSHFSPHTGWLDSVRATH